MGKSIENMYADQVTIKRNNGMVALFTVDGYYFGVYRAYNDI